MTRAKDLGSKVGGISLEDQDYYSDDDYSTSDSDYSDTETRPSTSHRSATHGQTNNAPVSNKQVLKEKTELFEKISQKINLDQYLHTKHRITKDKAERATVDQVLDPRTLRFLAKFFKNGIITEIKGCISTGKEANVYRGINSETGKEYAIKIYKTSILVFKDRERYVDGEYRFRNTKNQSNPRKMVKVWAEKEFRNLKRLHMSGIPSPEPIDLKSHVLAMEFLTKGEGKPSPKLRDYQFKDVEEVALFYHKMLVYMRWLFQKCKLVHADLSEYNSIVHEGELYIFDVSQSVEPDHQMSMDFLRMDIKNVNDFFSRIKKINVYPERLIFKFIIEPWNSIYKKSDEDDVVEDENFDYLENYLNELPLMNEDNETQKHEDEIFRSLHLVSSLNHLEERDFQKFSEGHIDTLRDLVNDKILDQLEHKEHKEFEDSVNLSYEDEDEVDDDDDYDDDDDDNNDDEDEDGDDDDDDKFEEREKGVLKGKKFEDKDAKKERKKAVKEAAKEKRKNKMKKSVKKKLVKKGHHK